MVRRTIHQQSYAPVPMETRGLVAEWSAPEGELTVWAATQAPHEVRMFAARLLGIVEHRVRVLARDPGGGFGQKVAPQREEMCVLLAARKVPAGLKWIEDRRENLMAAGQARHEHGDAAARHRDGNGRDRFTHRRHRRRRAGETAMAFVHAPPADLRGSPDYRKQVGARDGRPRLATGRPGGNR